MRPSRSDLGVAIAQRMLQRSALLLLATSHLGNSSLLRCLFLLLFPLESKVLLPAITIHMQTEKRGKRDQHPSAAQAKRKAFLCWGERERGGGTHIFVQLLVLLLWCLERLSFASLTARHVDDQSRS